MNKDLAFLFSLIAIGFLIYIICLYVDIKKLNFNKLNVYMNTKEGMTTDDSNSSRSGIAGNAKQFAAQIKAASVKLGDQLLINKYSDDYESAIMNMEDLMNNMMLKTVLSVDPSNPQKSIEALNILFQSKAALSDVMKYVDSQ
jgi:hypothetical protein